MLNVFKAYKKNPTIALRNRLVELNINLARSIVHNIAKTTLEPYEDLEQVAFIGLIAAVEKYDPDTGYKFSSYAVPLIQGKVLQYLRDKGTTIRIPQSLQDLYIRKIKTEDKLAHDLGRQPTTKEIIKALGVTRDRYNKTMLAGSNKYPTSLAHSFDEDDSTTLEDIIPAPTPRMVELIEENLVVGVDAVSAAVLQEFLQGKVADKQLLRKAIEELAAVKN